VPVEGGQQQPPCASCARELPRCAYALSHLLPSDLPPSPSFLPLSPPCSRSLLQPAAPNMVARVTFSSTALTHSSLNLYQRPSVKLLMYV